MRIRRPKESQALAKTNRKPFNRERVRSMNKEELSQIMSPKTRPGRGGQLTMNGNNDQSSSGEQRRYPKKKNEVIILPRNKTQEEYLELLKNPKKYIIFAVGSAGTGKTMIAVQYAIKQFKEGLIDKIVITRPAVSVDEQHGFLPGTLNQKMEPWVLPILDVFKEYYHPREINDMLDDGVLEIAPLAMMRGRTFKNAIIVADECQNTTDSQMKMLLTRIGENSRMIVTGDLNQADNPNFNGLRDFMKLMAQAEEIKMIDVVRFGTKDVERHPVVKEVLAIYKDFT